MILECEVEKVIEWLRTKQGNRPFRVKDVKEELGIPSTELCQIMLILKKGGFVNNRYHGDDVWMLVE